MKRGYNFVLVIAIIAIVLSVIALLVSSRLVNLDNAGITGNAIFSKKCVDSDNGVNLNVKGIVTSVSGNRWSDSCMQGRVSGVASCSGSDCFVTEITCSYVEGASVTPDGVYYKNYLCNTGCVKGACVSDAVQSASTAGTINNPYGPRGPRDYNAAQWAASLRLKITRIVGNPSGNYGNVPRYTKIQDAINAAKPNELILVADGDYDEDLSVKKKISLIAEHQGKAKIYGHHVFVGNYIKGFFVSQRSWPTLHCADSVCSNEGTREGLRVESGIAEDITAYRTDGSGIALRGNNVIVRNSLMQENARNGYVGGNNNVGPVLKNMQFYDNILVGNNARSFNAGYEGGGGKFLGTDGVVVRNVLSYNNIGKGIWFDYMNTNFEISYCDVYGNHDGIVSEVSGYGSGFGGKIHHNTVGENKASWTNPGNGQVVETGFGIGIWTSMNIQVYDNILTTRSPGGSIGVRQQTERAPYYLYNVTITGNKFQNNAIFATANIQLDSLKKGTYDSNSCRFTSNDQYSGKSFPSGCKTNICIKNNPGLDLKTC